MKPLPTPNVPGETEAARFDNAVRMLFSASKEAFAKEEVKRWRARERKKRKKKSEEVCATRTQPGVSSALQDWTALS